MASSQVSGVGGEIECDVAEFTSIINMPAISSAESPADGLVSPVSAQGRGPIKTLPQRAGGA